MSLNNVTSLIASPWAYSLYPSGTAPAITYPSTSSSIWNDNNLINFNYQSNGMLNTTTAMCQQLIPALNDWQAKVADMYKKIMGGITNGTNVNVNTNGVSPSSTNKNIDSSTGLLIESKILSEIAKLGTGKSTAVRMAKEITYKDKDGNEITTTLLNRITSLVKDYQENPDEPILSKENYTKIWVIATKYAQTGELSTDDYKTLIEIAKLDDTATETEEKRKKKKETLNSDTPISDLKEKRDAIAFKSGVNTIVDSYKGALIGCGTDYNQLNQAQNALNGDNVIEVMERYESVVGANHGETLVESIYNDFDDWTDGWFTTGSATTFNGIKEALLERVQNIIEISGENAELQEAMDLFTTTYNGFSDENYDTNKKAINDAFENFKNAIKVAEEKIIETEEKSQ